MKRTDEKLMAAHCEGDLTAFSEIVRRHGGSVLGYLTKMCSNRTQAEDFFQETFKRVHEKAHTYRGGSFKSWLFTIATRAAINGLRKRSRLEVVSLNRKVECTDGNCEELGAAVMVDNSQNPLDEAVRAEQKQQVKEAVESLPAKQRATLVLAYYQQLSYAQVAKVMGCSVGTVKTQMYRALKVLAQRLGNIAGELK